MAFHNYSQSWKDRPMDPLPCSWDSQIRPEWKSARIDPLQSNVLVFATVLVDTIEHVTRTSVAKDKEEISLLSHVVLAANGDLAKAGKHKVTYQREVIQDQRGTLVERDLPLDECAALYSADRSYMLEHGLRKEFLPPGAGPVSAFGVTMNAAHVQVACKNIFVQGEYILKRGQSKILEIIALYFLTGSVSHNLVDMFSGSHLLQNLELLLTSRVHASRDEITRLKAELETVKVTNLPEFQLVMHKLHGVTICVNMLNNENPNQENRALLALVINALLRSSGAVDPSKRLEYQTQLQHLAVRAQGHMALDTTIMTIILGPLLPDGPPPAPPLPEVVMLASGSPPAPEMVYMASPQFTGRRPGDRDKSSVRHSREDRDKSSVRLSPYSGRDDRYSESQRRQVSRPQSAVDPRPSSRLDPAAESRALRARLAELQADADREHRRDGHSAHLAAAADTGTSESDDAHDGPQRCMSATKVSGQVQWPEWGP